MIPLSMWTTLETVRDTVLSGKIGALSSIAAILAAILAAASLLKLSKDYIQGQPLDLWDITRPMVLLTLVCLFNELVLGPVDSLVNVFTRDISEAVSVSTKEYVTQWGENINKMHQYSTANMIMDAARELEEAAEIDGCSGTQVFFKIVLPLSKAMLGVILLYYAVGRWNNYTSSLYYQPRADELHSLQMVIKKMVLQMQAAANAESEMAEYYANLFNQIKYSVIVIASLPLLILYPFLQKYFEKGVMIGSVKG